MRYLLHKVACIYFISQSMGNPVLFCNNILKSLIIYTDDPIKCGNFVSIYALQATSIFFIRRIENRTRSIIKENETMTVGIKELSKICPISFALKSK